MSFRTELVCRYSPLWLLVPYFAGFGLCASNASRALYTFVADVVPVEENFSQILVTTRNPSLNKISLGLCLTSDQAAWLKKQRFRFGELIIEEGCIQTDKGGIGHAAFGLEGQTKPIQKGLSYH
ncbi:hypothetical protein N7510_006366 [Penicillium lagena]|uniref:uncharacterized protein n=1 Tax=Penicillium lagena TaxID=94218 RepID=UPI0025418F12|nr:uncharacterized protein N7510_006366 [Penicillium lagena]KAJ5613172.1 hypothetical protein N7510_006366 [Penicillium lagena]